MLFNSLEFLIFLPVVFFLYWFVFKNNLRLQNFLIVVAGYIFYGWWDYRFLSLIVLTTFSDYLLAKRIQNAIEEKRRKAWMFLSVGINIGILGFFKYYNFFAESLASAFGGLGITLDPLTLNIILPVGISFYTFQTMSYTIDVYKRQLTATRDFIGFAAFISFFPQLLAGPIERASNLLPQMLRKRHFDSQKALEGFRLMLFGFFKKIVIADTLAPVVNEIFQNHANYPGGTLFLGAIFFSIQIYGDFSGYSDIARGIAKFFGVDLMVNFNFPYFSRNIGEFWRRWHISLSSWFRDYLYIPLGGSKNGKWKGLRNIFIVFLVSGLWHGANWTFVAWGAIHAALFIPSFLLGTNKKYADDVALNAGFLQVVKTIIHMLVTYIFVTLAWIFFRAEDISTAFSILSKIATDLFSFRSVLNPYDNQVLNVEIFVLLAFIVLELVVYLKLVVYDKYRSVLNVMVDAALLSCIVLFAPVSSDLAFIYFQF